MPCQRCNGTAIDPEHSATDGIDGVAYLEPCAACQFPPEPVQPYGCAVCGDAQDHHGSQWDSTAGLHQWTRPSQLLIKQRMLARRAARLNAAPTQYHATTAWAADHTGESADPYCADCKTDSCPRWSRIQTRLDRIRWGIDHPTKHSLDALGGGWGAGPDLPF